jgi:hypothetical protein
VVEKTEAREALLTCLRDHLSVTDGVVAKATSQSPLRILRKWVADNKVSFVDLSKPLPKGHDHQTCPGYIYRADGRTWVAFSWNVVEQAVGGWTVKELKSELDRLGVIRRTGSSGKKSLRYAVKVNIGPKREYCCVIDASFFDS